MKLSFLAIFFAVLLITSCDAAFTGGGSGGVKKRFSGANGSGENNGNTPDVGPGSDGINGGGAGNGNVGANGGYPGGSLPGGTIVGGGSVDTRNYGPMTVKVHRRDKSAVDTYDHSHITLAYQVVGGKQVESGTIGEEGKTFTIERGCPDSGSVNAVIQFQLENGTRISPTKATNVGGPIGYRRSDHSILVGFEKEGVNNPEETAYHNNDDLVMEFICNTARVTIKDLCYDQRIPDNGWDLVSDDITYSNDEPPQGFGAPARLCNGT